MCNTCMRIIYTFFQAEEIQAKKLDLLQQRRAAMERKLTRADEKRQLQLQKKVRKAHEEENKVCS